MPTKLGNISPLVQSFFSRDQYRSKVIQIYDKPLGFVLQMNGFVFILFSFAMSDQLNHKNWALTEYQQFTSALEARLCQLLLLTVHFQNLPIVCFAFLAKTNWSLLQHDCTLCLAPALFFNIIVSHHEGTVIVMAFLLAH